MVTDPEGLAKILVQTAWCYEVNDVGTMRTQAGDMSESHLATHAGVPIVLSGRAGIFWRPSRRFLGRESSHTKIRMLRLASSESNANSIQNLPARFACLLLLAQKLRIATQFFLVSTFTPFSMRSLSLSFSISRSYRDWRFSQKRSERPK